MPLNYVHRSADGYTRCWACFLEGQHAEACGVHLNPEMGRCTCQIKSPYITHKVANGYTRHSVEQERECEYCQRAEQRAKQDAQPRPLTVEQKLEAAQDENALQVTELAAALGVIAHRDGELIDLRERYAAVLIQLGKAEEIVQAAQAVQMEMRATKIKMQEMEAEVNRGTAARVRVQELENDVATLVAAQARFEDLEKENLAAHARIEELESAMQEARRGDDGEEARLVARVRDLERQLAAFRLTGGLSEPEAPARRGRPPKLNPVETQPGPTTTIEAIVTNIPATIT